jgi:dTDP-4-amino-4,6-dideoxygalactose transaminase
MECEYKDFNYKFPNSLAYLAKKELEKIKIYRTHRILISEYYDNSIKNSLIKILFNNEKKEINNYFRYPILLKSEKIKNEFYDYMKKNNILL